MDFGSFAIFFEGDSDVSPVDAGFDYAVVIGDNANAVRVIDRSSETQSLHEITVPLPFSSQETRARVYFNRDVVFIWRGDLAALLPAGASGFEDEGDVRRRLAAPDLMAVSALSDPVIPGIPQAPTDPEILYQCPYGHRLKQRLSSPNRTCPVHDVPIVAI